jgi:hypothetical protein
MGDSARPSRLARRAWPPTRMADFILLASTPRSHSPIDAQPISDQQSRSFSNQVSLDPVELCIAKVWRDQGSNRERRLRSRPQSLAYRSSRSLRVAAGFDDIRHWERYHLDGKIIVTNLTNKVALYNFLSSFSGTHFVTPRSVQGELRLRF